MRKDRNALGRGLSALIEKKDPAPKFDVIEVDPGRIAPGNSQPRELFDETEIEALAESISKHGVLLPLIVSRTDDGRFNLISGERRLRACRKIGLKRVPVMVRDFTGGMALEVALIENIQRQDLNPVEKAKGFDRLIEEYGYKHDEIAKVMGKSRAFVANSIRLLKLPPVVLEAMVAGSITEGHARAILMVEGDASREVMLERIIEGELSVREAEILAKRVAEGALREPPRTPAAPKVYTDIEKRLSERLGTGVKVTKGKRKGRIVIEFNTEDELHNIIGYFK